MADTDDMAGRVPRRKERNRMARAWLAAALMFLAAVSAAAQDAKPAEDLPTIDVILEKLIQASGGREALEKVTSRTYKGTFEMPSMGSTGTFERYEKAPNKSLNVTVVEGFGTVMQGCDGKTAWDDNPMIGLVERTGTSLADARRDSEFQRELKMKELYKKLAVVRKESLGSRTAYVVEATPQEGAVETQYYDSETGLLLRSDAEREGPQGPVRVTAYYEDYKDVDGLKFPHAIKQEMGEFAFVLRFTEIKLNEEIDDAKFAKPAPK